MQRFACASAKPGTPVHAIAALVPRLATPSLGKPSLGTPSIGTEERSRELTALLPPYAVHLHNDDVNSMDYVIHCLLVCVPELDEADAASIMLEAHESGRAQVIVCPLERAELYRERLEGRGLTATIARA